MCLAFETIPIAIICLRRFRRNLGTQSSLCLSSDQAVRGKLSLIFVLQRLSLI